VRIPAAAAAEKERLAMVSGTAPPELVLVCIGVSGRSRSPLPRTDPDDAARVTCLKSRRGGGRHAITVLGGALNAFVLAVWRLFLRGSVMDRPWSLTDNCNCRPLLEPCPFSAIKLRSLGGSAGTSGLTAYEGLTSQSPVRCVFRVVRSRAMDGGGGTIGRVTAIRHCCEGRR
jgi:hypothetical protein